MSRKNRILGGKTQSGFKRAVASERRDAKKAEREAQSFANTAASQEAHVVSHMTLHSIMFSHYIRLSTLIKTITTIYIWRFPWKMRLRRSYRSHSLVTLLYQLSQTYIYFALSLTQTNLCALTMNTVCINNTIPEDSAPVVICLSPVSAFQLHRLPSMKDIYDMKCATTRQIVNDYRAAQAAVPTFLRHLVTLPFQEIPSWIRPLYRHHPYTIWPGPRGSATRLSRTSNLDRITDIALAREHKIRVLGRLHRANNRRQQLLAKACDQLREVENGIFLAWEKSQHTLKVIWKNDPLVPEWVGHFTQPCHLTHTILSWSSTNAWGHLTACILIRKTCSASWWTRLMKKNQSTLSGTISIRKRTVPSRHGDRAWSEKLPAMWRWSHLTSFWRSTAARLLDRLKRYSMVEYTAFSALYSWEILSSAHRQYLCRLQIACSYYLQKFISTMYTIRCKHTHFTLSNTKNIYIASICLRQITSLSNYHSMSYNGHSTEQNILVPDTVCHSSTILDVKVTCHEYTCDRLFRLPTGLREVLYLHVRQTVSNLSHDAKRMITWLEGVASGDIEPSITPPPEIAITHTNEAITHSYTDAECIIRRIDALEHLVWDLTVPLTVCNFLSYRMHPYIIPLRPTPGPTALTRWTWGYLQGRSTAHSLHLLMTNHLRTTMLGGGTWNRPRPAEHAGSIIFDVYIVDLYMTLI